MRDGDGAWGAAGKNYDVGEENVLEQDRVGAGEGRTTIIVRASCVAVQIDGTLTACPEEKDTMAVTHGVSDLASDGGQA